MSLLAQRGADVSGALEAFLDISERLLSENSIQELFKEVY